MRHYTRHDTLLHFSGGNRVYNSACCVQSDFTPNFQPPNTFYFMLNFISPSSTSIRLSCLHFGQNKGKLRRTVSLFTFVFVLLWQMGQCTQPYLSIICSIPYLKSASALSTYHLCAVHLYDDFCVWISIFIKKFKKRF